MSDSAKAVTASIIICIGQILFVLYAPRKGTIVIAVGAILQMAIIAWSPGKMKIAKERSPESLSATKSS